MPFSDAGETPAESHQLPDPVRSIPTLSSNLRRHLRATSILPSRHVLESTKPHQSKGKLQSTLKTVEEYAIAHEGDKDRKVREWEDVLENKKHS